MIKTKLSILAILTVLVTTLSADVKQQNTQAPCNTRVECDAMLKDLEGKIDVLNKKADLTNSDKELDNIFGKIDVLEQEKTSILITSKDLELAQSKAKTAQQRKIIAQEKAETAEIIKTNKKLEEIGTLLKK